MSRRRAIITAAAAFAIGVAFAAQPTSVGADRRRGDVQQREPWVPGTNMVMSAHEAQVTPLAPAR
ncbi:MAG: hypothetical protein ABSH33_10940 [Steroidobacteraceae bacterium]|jgi:hypothetical protein